MSWSGCVVTPADKAFVEGVRAFHTAHGQRIREHVAFDSNLRDVEKARLWHEVDDYEAMILANEQRVGLVSIAAVGS